MGDDIRDLFDDNAATYDRINTLISFGLDSRWREWVAKRAVRDGGLRVLDAFAGTGLVGLRAARLGAEVTLADVSPAMLAVADARAREAFLQVDTVVTDLTATPPVVPGVPFDAITMVFGARYLSDPTTVIRSLSGLLRPGGAFVLLDFVEPPARLLSRLAAVYFFRVLPFVAGALAGRRELYDYLVASTHAMGPAEHLVSLATSAGLEVVETRSMGFGLVLGVVARSEGRR